MDVESAGHAIEDQADLHPIPGSGGRSRMGSPKRRKAAARVHARAAALPRVGTGIYEGSRSYSRTSAAQTRRLLLPFSAQNTVSGLLRVPPGLSRCLQRQTGERYRGRIDPGERILDQREHSDRTCPQEVAASCASSRILPFEGTSRCPKSPWCSTACMVTSTSSRKRWPPGPGMLREPR